MSIFYFPWYDFFVVICGCITFTLLLAKDVHCQSVIKTRWWKYLLFAVVFTILLNFLFSLSYVESLKQFAGIYLIALFLLFLNIQHKRRTSVKSSCSAVVRPAKNEGSEAENSALVQQFEID
jgi:hypothetical protein